MLLETKDTGGQNNITYLHYITPKRSCNMFYSILLYFSIFQAGGVLKPEEKEKPAKQTCLAGGAEQISLN